MNIPSVNGLSPVPSTAPPAANDAASAKGNSGVTAVIQRPSSPIQSEGTTKKPSEEQLQDVVNAANDLIKPYNDALQFSIDKDTGTTVVKVIDINTKEVIKQMPSEEMLAMAKALDQLKGLLVKQKA